MYTQITIDRGKKQCYTSFIILRIHSLIKRETTVRLHTVVCFMSDLSCSEQRCSYSAASSPCRPWIPFSFFKLTAPGRVSSGSRMKD